VSRKGGKRRIQRLVDSGFRWNDEIGMWIEFFNTLSVLEPPPLRGDPILQ
jgi:hypothetical protein